ncbi:hypothetical protein PHYSODRAFT_306378 [Phytophthora sojae]|uniref:Uncharacterized protein n=1 Tax=Phytophthora sojae (strain P6497) TaxID=1094619 RepID=G5A9A5_PHYSP|nr:hypothetical protein PHYSODRAFT_306378 [Phytophthora sojae]EGZ08481.1 hypothetical protein PHYSODRAFT_306378 [Phytophthora sojae]|eukprot:XP_009536653.1 hypothetical protein PHYSODRAFT_306378 [Phytophthora sojae]
MPANAAWNWISPDTQFEFFDGQNGQNDVAIELAEGQPLPDRTIMPDINNVVVGDWSHGTIFFSSAFRCDDGEIFQRDVGFTGLSVEIEGKLHHHVEAANGDSGAMLYRYVGDTGELIPVGVITGKWEGPAFSKNP